MDAKRLRLLTARWEAARRGEMRRLAAPQQLALGRALIESGHSAVACEVLDALLGHRRLGAAARYFSALAYTRCGSYRRATDTLAPLLADRALDETLHVDALSLAGRIAKDRWARLPEGAAAVEALNTAIQRYRDAFASTGHSFPGINAASLLVLAGEDDAGRTLAGDVQRRIVAGDDVQGEPWRSATLGEAALLLGDLAAAQRHYAEAARHAAGRHDVIASIRRQLRLLARRLSIPADLLASLPVPRSVLFSGHMIDTPERSPPRFPPAIADAVGEAIGGSLARCRAATGYCSAACGGDILFIERMLARGGDVHLTLPFHRNDFIATSVRHAGTAWVRRFEQAMHAASSVHYGVHERYRGDEALFDYAGLLMQGAAVLHAQELEGEASMLAVCDPSGPVVPGGTLHMVERWRDRGLPVEIIDIRRFRAPTTYRSVTSRSSAAAHPSGRSGDLRRHVRTMLFADMVGFSKLDEEDTPAFLVGFLGAVANEVQHARQHPVFLNTWGDGLFMVFDDVVHGVDFALRLRDTIIGTDWPQRGLPARTTIRIGMHVGPTFRAHDPLIGRDNFFGSHVVRAARIEPATAPGSIYVSEALASLLAALPGDDFATDIVGNLPLAKGYGRERLYRLRRRHETE